MRTAWWSLLGLSLLLGCDRAPSAQGLPEWKPGDHHSADDPAGGGQSPGQAAPARSGTDIPALVDVAWRQDCAKCHGPGGHGDGPQGPMLHARDLTDPAWQGKVSDADIAASIRSGKDKMPKYDLPDGVVQGLVARIRALKGG